MLLCGMRVTKKRVLLISFLVFIVLFFLLLIILFSIYKEERYLDSNDYYERMLLSLETSSELKMKDVFEFEFDKAYVAYETYGDEKYFLKELNVDTNVDIPILESGAQNRILFINDDKIIYDFIYEMSEICIPETGIWVVQDTTLILTQQNSSDKGKSIIQIDFGTQGTVSVKTKSLE